MTDSQGSVLEVRERVGCAISTAVDREYHSLSAVRSCGIGSLRTVHPDRLRIVYSDGVSREVISRIG